jgi:hypothetical protein
MIYEEKYCFVKKKTEGNLEVKRNLRLPHSTDKLIMLLVLQGDKNCFELCITLWDILPT